MGHRAVEPLPTGTVTFLFTDIEGSTKLWQECPAAMTVALDRHHALLHDAIESQGGYVFQIVGDAFCAAFRGAPDAVAAAIDAQRALAAASWSETGPLRVRMAVHTGTVEVQEGAYRSGEYRSGLTLSHAARLLSAGHGGQILVSRITHELTRDGLPPGVSFRDLGERRLRDLVRPEQIFQVVAPALREDFPALRSLDLYPNNLPHQLTSFIGRQRELREVRKLLDEHRLVTLTGPGGTGKTRLSLQASADVFDAFADGVWFVEFAPLADAALVPQVVASALDIREEGDRPLLATLAGHVSRRTLLLILDNCEHLVEACARLADGLLRACPNVKIVASSREPLGVDGEIVYRVPSLSLPDPRSAPLADSLADYEAIRLLVERASAVRRDFAVTAENAGAIVQICYRLDGIPLAIELAAARLKLLSVQQIAAHLDERFRLLTAGSRTALQRHQTLRALIDWSYGLLSDEERTLLQRLSVFAGGWTLAAAEAIGDGDVLDLLSRLVDKSLVMTDDIGGESRYRLLETIRQYSRDRLLEAGDEPSVRDRHRNFFLTVAEQMEPHLHGPDQAAWFQSLDRDHDNLRAALRWSLDRGDVEASLRFGASLWHFWDTRGHVSEGRECLDEILTKPTTHAPVQTRRAQAQALSGAARMAERQSDYERGRERYVASLALWRELGDRTGAAEALNSLGAMTVLTGDRAGAKVLVEESLALFREVGDKRGVAHALNNLADIVSAEGDESGARSLYEESVPLFREIRDNRGLAHGLNNLGGIRARHGDLGDAEALYQESLRLSQQLDDAHAIATVQRSLGSVARARRDYARAEALYDESIESFARMGDRYCGAKSLVGRSEVAYDRGDTVRARTLTEQALTVFRELNFGADATLCLELLGRITGAAHRPGDGPAIG
jgi:predicted ATPase/class 3 adenylate cyclase